MYAKITKDHLFDGTTIPNDRTGTVLLDDGLPHQDDTCMKVKIYDDDDELYYEALVDGADAMEELFEWAIRDSGVTRLDAFDEINNEWKMVMG